MNAFSEAGTERIREIVREEIHIANSGYSWEGKPDSLRDHVIDHLESCLQMVDDLAEGHPVEPTLHRFIVVCPDCGEHLITLHLCSSKF